MLEREIRLFLDALEAERGLSGNTVAAYRRDLLRLDEHLGELGVAASAAVTLDHLTSFAEAERVRGLKASSRARAIVAVRMLFRFLKSDGLLPADPAERLGVPAREHRIPRVLTLAEVELVLGSPDRTRPLGLRDRAALEMLYASGARASELTGLRAESVTDLDLPEARDPLGAVGRGPAPLVDGVGGVVRLLGKGNRERVVPIAVRARRAFDAYLRAGRPVLAERRRRAGSPVPEVAFLTRLGAPLRREDVFRLLGRHLKRAGVETEASPHVLRHTFATHLLENGAELRLVQELLGHARVTTTQVYTHVDRKRLRSTIDRFHPRSVV